MTISPDRIEAEIAAEVKRIGAWMTTHPNPKKDGPKQLLYVAEIRSLAEHLVRNRLQVEDARLQALLEAARNAIAGFEELIVYLRRYGDNPELARDRMQQLRAAIAPFEERTP